MTIFAPTWVWILVLVFILCLVLVIWALSRESKTIYGFMDDILKRATEATTEDELTKLQLELVEWSKGRCWHGNYAARAKEVFMYIQGRRNAFIVRGLGNGPMTSTAVDDFRQKTVQFAIAVNKAHAAGNNRLVFEEVGKFSEAYQTLIEKARPL